MQITVTGKGTIKYIYDAAGNKLQKAVVEGTDTSITLYMAGSVYQNDTLQFFGTSEGRARPVGSTRFVYDYFLKDHLGNTRMVITDDYNVASPILEATSYYPFGLQQKGIGLTASGSLHNYKNTFQKQEFNEDLGVDMYEFKYRMDDPQIGRFWQVDPLADKYVYNSTYAFSENKVTSDVELEGLEAARMVLPRDVTEQQENEVIKGMTKASGTAGKYVGIVAGIATGNPIAIILGIPALGLTASQDIALAKNPNNQAAKQMPTSAGGVMGMVIDKVKESATQTKSKGTFQAGGELVESLYNGKELLKNPVVSKNVVENVDKVNTVVEIIDKTKNFFKNLFNWSSIPSAPPPPPPPSPKPLKSDDKNKQ